MRVIVSEHEITIIKDENINEKESNIQKIEFEFSNIYDGFSKYALITDLNNKTEKIVIKDNQIPMPYFEEEQRIIFGIYAEKIVDEKLYRLNPKPEHFDIDKGSLREAENHKEITPPEFEQYMQLLNDGLNNVDKKLTDSLNAIDENFKKGINAINDRLKTVEESSKQVEQIGEKVSKQGLEAEKKGNYAEEKANEVINANNQAKEIIDEFESNVDKYTSNFNSNATKKETTYNNNHEVKLKEYNDNHKTKTDKFNSNASLKAEEFNINAVNKTNDFNNNSSTKINEFDDNAINKKADFNNNVTEKTNIFDNNVVEKTNEFNENVDSIQKDITTNSNEIQNVKDTVLEVSSAEGDYITLDNGVNMQLAEFKIDGALKQASTKGYQLLKGTETFNAEFWLKSPYAVYKDNDYLGFTSLYCNAKDSKEEYLDIVRYGNIDFLESETDYILSFYAKGTSVTTYLYPSVNKNAISSQGVVSAAVDGKMTFQLTEDWERYYVKYSTRKEIESIKSILFRVFQGDDATICGVMFEKGSEVHGWEPYTGMQASPNFEYPQDIKVFENNLELDVCGGQLFDYTDTALVDDEFVVDADGWITFAKNNAGTSIAYRNYYTNISKHLEPSKNYALFLEVKNVEGSFLFYPFSETTGAWVSQASSSNKINISDLTNNTVYKYTFNTVDNFELCNTMIRTFIRMNVGESGSITFRLSVTEDLTIPPEKFIYEPYKENKYTFDLKGNYVAKFSDKIRDKLYTEYNDVDGKYHLLLDKKIGRIVLNGSENWKKNYFDSNNTQPQFYVTLDEIKPSSNIVCTHSMFGGGKSNRVYASKTKLLVFIDPVNSDITLEEFKILVNGVEVYYELEQPYILDLGPIEMPKTYNGINHIFTNSELQPEIAINYYKDFKDTIKKLDNSDRELFEALSTSKISGKDLYIKDAAKCKLANFEKEGFLKQETTEGYNLLNIPDGAYTSVANALSIEFKDGIGIITVLDNSFETDYFIIPSAPLTLKAGNYTETNGQTMYPYMTPRNDNTNIITATNASDNGLKSFSVNEDVTINNLNLFFRRVINGQNMVPEKIYPMILSGTYTHETIPEFEKFTYGASPNPNYPQNIELLNDDFDLTIESSNPDINNKATVLISEGEFAAAFSNGVKDILRTEYNELDGKYHLMLDKKIGKMTLNGTEIWRIASEGFWMSVPSTEFKNKSILKSDYYINYSSAPIFNQQNYAIGFLYNDVYQLYIRDKDVTTITEFKQKLSEHNVTVYYELANGYTIDLGPVEMPKTYKGINHINTSDDESDIEVEYVLDAKLYIDNVLSELLNKSDTTVLQNEIENEDNSETNEEVFESEV